MSTFALIFLAWILISFVLGPLCLFIVSEPPAPDESSDRSPALDPRHQGLTA